MAFQVDLRQLAGPRTSSGQSPQNHRHRLRWFTRYLLPLGLLAGFVGLLFYSFREAFLSAAPVTVVPVMAVRAEIQRPDAPVFQSAGWVEPRPTPVIVSALQEGVVEELLVIEGQELKKGDKIARLIDADAKLYLRDAEAEVGSRRAELASSEAVLSAAATQLNEPIELETKLAEVEALVARVDNELTRLPSQLKTAEARVELATQELHSRRQSSDVVSKLALARAENEFAASTAGVVELAAQRLALANEQAAQQRRLRGLRRQRELKVDEHRQHDVAQAAVDLAESRLVQAQVALAAAELRLSRMQIHAPCDGTVLALVAGPGTKVMGLALASMPDASTVITMYDSSRLQIRADVRLEEVSHVFPGQQTLISTPVVAKALHGEVIALTSLTDIQKNTLQVKVSVTSPPPILKPDMLVQVSFLAPSIEQTGPTSDSSLSLVIPADLVQQVGNQAVVWVADRQHGVALRRSVTLGGMTADGLREVRAGLALGDRLIAGGTESLRSGDRIRIVGEVSDKSMTRSPNAPGAPLTTMKRL